MHVNTASQEEKEESKKDQSDILGDDVKERLCRSITDESFLFYDSLVRRVWIDANKRPVVRVTGSHKH